MFLKERKHCSGAPGNSWRCFRTGHVGCLPQAATPLLRQCCQPEKCWFHHGVHRINPLDLGCFTMAVQLHHSCHSWAASCFAFPASCSSFWRKLAASAAHLAMDLRFWECLGPFRLFDFDSPKVHLPVFSPVVICFALFYHDLTPCDTAPPSGPEDIGPRTAFEAEFGWTHLLPWLYDTWQLLWKAQLGWMNNVNPGLSRISSTFTVEVSCFFLFCPRPWWRQKQSWSGCGFDRSRNELLSAFGKFWYSHVFTFFRDIETWRDWTDVMLRRFRTTRCCASAWVKSLHRFSTASQMNFREAPAAQQLKTEAMPIWSILQCLFHLRMQPFMMGMMGCFGFWSQQIAKYGTVRYGERHHVYLRRILLESWRIWRWWYWISQALEKRLLIFDHSAITQL